MPVTPIAFAFKSFKPTGASGSVSVPITVPENADDLAAIAGTYWFGEPDISAATFTATLGGDPMDEMENRLWDNTDKLTQYGLSGPDPGPTNAVINYSGISGGALRCLGVAVGIYSGVGGIDTPVDATPTSTTTPTVVVPSIAAAHRGVFLHASRKRFSAYNQIKRASLRMSDSEGALWWWDSIEGELLMGDTPGVASMTSTATQPATDNWAAIGVNLAPAPVNLSFGTVKVAPPEIEMALSIYRVQEIDPARIWKITPKNRPPTWERDPQSVYDYTWDWSDILTGDDEIASVTFRSSSPGLETFSWNKTATTGTVWVRGPATADVTCHMTSDGGREDERTAKITAVQK